MTLTQKWRQRLAAFFYIFVIEYIASKAMPLVPRDGLYYVICIAINYATMLGFERYFTQTELVADLKWMIQLQMGVQLCGLVLYEVYAPAEPYNKLILLVVVVTYIRCILWLPGDSDLVSCLENPETLCRKCRCGTVFYPEPAVPEPNKDADEETDQALGSHGFALDLSSTPHRDITY